MFDKVHLFFQQQSQKNPQEGSAINGDSLRGCIITSAHCSSQPSYSKK